MIINPRFIPADTTERPALINLSRIAYVNFVALTNCYQVYFDGGDMTIATNPQVAMGLKEIKKDEYGTVFVNLQAVQMIIGKEPPLAAGTVVFLNIAEQGSAKSVELHLPEPHSKVLEMLGINTDGHMAL